jgi:Tfp pilus assembly protein PilF
VSPRSFIVAAVLAIPLALRADPPPPLNPAQPAGGEIANAAGSAKLPPEARAAAEAGISAMGKANFPAAETAFLKLLNLSPDNVSALVNLGLAEFRLGRSEAAQKYLERAIRVKPDTALAWMMLGVISMNQNDLVAATASLAQAVYLNPKSPQAHNYFAVVLAKRGWNSAAEDELQTVIRLAPDFAEAHFNLALLYLDQTPPAVELARRHYQKALDLGAPPDAGVAAKLAAAPQQTVLP